jgi:hypothetical protein
VAFRIRRAGRGRKPPPQPTAPAQILDTTTLPSSQELPALVTPLSLQRNDSVRCIEGDGRDGERGLRIHRQGLYDVGDTEAAEVFGRAVSDSERHAWHVMACHGLPHVGFERNAASIARLEAMRRAMPRANSGSPPAMASPCCRLRCAGCKALRAG